MTMGLRCKVGDLAVVVNAEQTSNLGQIVEVLGLPTNRPFKLNGPGHVWQVRTVSGRKSLHYRMPKGHFRHLSTGPVPDCRLRPIPGLLGQDSVTRQASAVATMPTRKACTAEAVVEGVET